MKMRKEERLLPMKIVIAPDSYKKSLTALEVATGIEAGFREIFPDADYLKLPMADGGEGTVTAMVAATGGHICHKKDHIHPVYLPTARGIIPS